MEGREELNCKRPNTGISECSLQSEQEHVTLSNEVRGLVISTNTGDCSVPERKQTIINAKQFTRSDANNSGPVISYFQFLPLGFLTRTLTSTCAFMFSPLCLAVLNWPRVVISTRNLYFIWSQRWLQYK